MGETNGGFIALAVAFCAVIVFNAIPLMAGPGLGWDALNPFTYNLTLDERFDAEPEGFEAQYYFWQLPANQKTDLTQALPWLFYLLHQTTVWAVIYYASMRTSNDPEHKYSAGLRWFNWLALIINSVFHIAHMIISFTTYEMLAFDTPEASSQGSVILMLVVVLILEFRVRGIFLGWPGAERRKRWSRSCRLSDLPGTIVRKFHGYLFAWAAIYTLWYHPNESTAGHFLGFMHTSMILLQGSLAFTNAHLNRYWRLANEAMVLIHSTVVAVQTENPLKPNSLWPRFTLGFLFLLCFTQIYGLQFWAKIHMAWRVVPPVIFFVVWGSLYGAVIQTWQMSWEFVQIPLIEYGFALLFFLLLWGLINIVFCARQPKKPSARSPMIVTSLTAALIGFTLLALTLINWGFHRGSPIPFDLTIDLILLMVILVCIYTIIFAVLFACLTVVHNKPEIEISQSVDKDMTIKL